MKPSKFINAIDTKKYPDSLEGYNPYPINRILAMYPDCIFHANQMNMNHHIDKKWQFDYYYHELRQRKR